MQDIAHKVVEAIANTSGKHTPTYDWNDTVENKLNAIATKIYGAKNVEYSVDAKSDIKRINNLGLSNLPICVAKTQKSLSDNPDLIGRPRDFTLNVREIQIAAGAGCFAYNVLHH